ncbi:TetR/AcrR family transcriptional regulator [Nocardia cyriacigeorgica]|jgi:AcrR family transcriptional regulator|uniref:TetR/AcrR family transcriptional regulator n=1 Tax=Nocardia cyriacigeorgica TaxID=135487 RepID=UPI000CE9AFD3|nr:TetR/AcrR family transcriptional regulator [Nocardia cyriacigeorgica]MBF6087728.1 TetR/AcrR family transcriptional regulator [Nocardia cyriacigeorgica]MBF6094353.1 TetR/AcrR family transcriptional regulator [Nocardia cyriacigeorgica]MBF6322462.1 TetR/AcrR family transcriptional regulator [Nocardia cyriacigeorgica]MBF6495677.1 TetR/AcrR family transcriptional regulator [Nocardia cyriacigeorgica]PPJ16676.1 TetR/AcrR family transcriptional regulator [Nocardia cyriacigeorgica]
MSTRRRLAPEQRRRLLVDAGARLFAERPYDAVLMEDVATAAGVSRALLYRHFPTKRELFAAVYEQASADLLVATELDAARPFAEQLAAGLDAHFDYFEANAHSVIAANRVLATDPTIQAIISGELGELRRRMLDVLGVDGQLREATSAVLMSWLTYVRVLTIDWLDNGSLTREQIRQVSVGALLGALEPLLGKPGHAPDSTG